MVTEIKIRAECRTGELLKEKGFGKYGGDRKSSNTMQLDTLSELGINKMQSSRWQAVADIPEEKLEKHIARKVVI